MNRSGGILLPIKASEWHASPEPIVLTRQNVEVRPARNFGEWSILFANDTQQSCAENRVGLRVTHALPTVPLQDRR